MIDAILSTKDPDQMIRIRAAISGRVQGVGFRPMVYRYATQIGLSGFVNNTPGGVLLEVQGNRDMLARFFKYLAESPPPSSHIESMELQEVDLVSEQGFLIAISEQTGETIPAFPPDLATCTQCRSEILLPSDRRHRYPFTNCIQCGPRFTIIESLPYDRERTSMRAFAMCAACRTEYETVQDRRFHAQPNACPQCGPQLQCLDGEGRVREGEPLEAAQTLLEAGKILAIKGVGGYHLACDATSRDAVAVLRKRKHRPHKSLAVMFPTMTVLREYCHCSPGEEALLQDQAAPIVLLKRKVGCALADNIAPDTDDVGAFLPYSPLHHLIMTGRGPLVMTSGNLAEEPIVKDETALKDILGSVADGALVHNRPIVRRCDDSVVRLVGDTPMLLRRSRGYVPEPVELPFEGPSVLAAGADLKNAFCITKGNWAFMSQHIGDLQDVRAHEFFREQVRDFSTLLHADYEIGVCDMHPDYYSSRIVREAHDKHIVEVQHHHAHIASVMVEHQLQDKVIGIALDGTGYGPDQTVWGGEILLADFMGFERLGHFRHVPMPGGDQAVRHPRRMALAYLYAYLQHEAIEAIPRYLAGIRADDRAMLVTMLEQGVQSPLTSSAGRLFDAVAGLIGLQDPVTYEGQAAIQLQFLTDPGERQAYTIELEEQDGILELSFGTMLRQLLVDISSGASRGKVSAKFHNMLVNGLTDACRHIRGHRGVDRVALSGGVFQNQLLLGKLTAQLHHEGFQVYTNQIVPVNDGGIALGQAAIALANFQDVQE